MKAKTMEVFIDTREANRYMKEKHARGRQRKQRVKDPDHKRCTLKDACHHFNGMHIYNLLSRRQALANALRRDARWSDAENVDSTPFYQYTLGDLLGVDSELMQLPDDSSINLFKMMIELFGLVHLIELAEKAGYDEYQNLDVSQLLELIGLSAEELCEEYLNYQEYMEEYLEDQYYQDSLNSQDYQDFLKFHGYTDEYIRDLQQKEYLDEQEHLDFCEFLKWNSTTHHDLTTQPPQQEQLCSISIHADIPFDELQALPDLFKFLQSLGAKNISAHTEL